MDKKTKRTIMSFIVFAIVVYAAVMNIDDVLNFFKGLWHIVKPVCVGLILAFVLNVPMKGFEKLFQRMFKNSKRKPPVRLIYLLSLISAIVVILLILSLALVVAIPGIKESAISIYELLVEKIPEGIKLLEKYNVDTTKLSEWAETFDFGSVVEKVTVGAGELVINVISFATATLSGLVSFLFGFVISLYVLVSKDTVIRRVKKLLYTTLKKEHADSFCNVCALSNKIFSQYLTGQCIEACILGALITITFLIFRLPYAGVIGLMTGISAFIPYVGAFIACFIGAFLILLVSPMQALISIIVFCVVQFIETQFIYPHVVGNSVGLSPLLTLIAALVGGNLMGLFGIVFFIPLTAVVFSLYKDYANKKLDEKNIRID